MADSKKISYDDIAERKLLDPLKKELEEVNKLLEMTENNLKGVVSEAAKIAKATPLDSFENIEQVEKSIEDTTKAIKELDKVEKDRIKLQERLAQLDDERVKANFDLREQIRRQTKELRDDARAAAESGDAYRVLVRQTNAAQAEYKRLMAEVGGSSKELKEARRNFERLDKELRAINDSAKDGRRDVGRYEKGVKSLNKTFKAFAAATVVLKILELLQNSISQNSEGAAEFEKIWVQVTTVIEVFGRRVVEAFPIIRARIENFFVSVQIGFLEFRESVNSAIDSVKEFFGADTTSGAEDFSKRIAELRKEQAELAKTADGDLAAAFAGLGAEIEDLTNKKVQLIDDTLRYRREIVALEQDIANLIPEQEKLRAEFENDSASLEEQIRAGVAFREQLQERFRIEETIAARRLRLAQQNAAANSVSVDAQEELSQATIEYNQLIADQAGEIAATEREIQKLRDDAVQLNLDFYVDDAQNRIDTNARIIADETQTFERRRELLEANGKEIERANDLRADALNQSLRERGKAELDFEDLRKRQSSEEIARIIRESGISEPLAIRALEIIRERRTELQDLAEAQRDLSMAEAESRDIQSDIVLQQRALNRLEEEGVDLEMVLNELAEARLKNDISNLRARIALAEEGSAEFITLNQELNDKLLEQDQARLDKEKKLQQERLKDLAKFGEAAQKAFTLLSDIADDRAEKRLEAIDAEINAEEARAQRLQELADQGNEDAENNLALSERRQAELEAQRQRQIERQQRQELAFTAIQTYASKVQAGDPNPLASTISDISVLRAFVNSLPGFYEGSEKVGDDLAATIPGKDGHVIRVDGSERIMTGWQNSLVGPMTNTELAMLALKERNRSAKKEANSMFIVKELQELKKVTRDKPVYLGSDYDKIAGAVVDKIKKGTKLERVHRKNGGIWG